MPLDPPRQPACDRCSLSAARLLAIIRFQTEVAKAGLDLAEVVERTTQLAQDLTRASGALLEMADGTEMVYPAACGIAEPMLGLRLGLDSSLSGACVEQGRALLCEDSETDPRVNRDVCRRVGLRSMAVVPLLHRGGAVGVLKVLSPEPGFFQGEAIQTLELISEVIGAAMANAREHASRIEESQDLFLRATRDSLTGLGNRALFYDHLHQCLAQARRAGLSAGVALVDMDGLKELNDTYGHRAGDAALRTLADRLRQTARAADTVARLGGDEFGLVLPALGDPQAAAAFGAKLAERVGGAFRFEGREHPLAASVGVALFPGDGRDPERLLAVADEAMYRMKREHKAGRAGLAPAAAAQS